MRNSNHVCSHHKIDNIISIDNNINKVFIYFRVMRNSNHVCSHHKLDNNINKVFIYISEL